MLLKYAVWSILPNADILQENLEKYSIADGDFEFQALYLKILDFFSVMIMFFFTIPIVAHCANNHITTSVSLKQYSHSKGLKPQDLHEVVFSTNIQLPESSGVFRRCLFET